MGKPSVGEKILKISAVSAVVIAALILLDGILFTMGLIFVVNPHAFAVCVSLLVRGLMGWKHVKAGFYERASRPGYSLVSGAVAAVLSLLYLVRRLRYLLISLSFTDILYILTLPVAVLFLVGVLLRRKNGEPGEPGEPGKSGQ